MKKESPIYGPNNCTLFLNDYYLLNWSILAKVLAKLSIVYLLVYLTNYFEALVKMLKRLVRIISHKYVNFYYLIVSLR